MPGLKEFCSDMQRCPHIMSFSEIGEALSTGALAGRKSGIPNGALVGSVLGLCIVAGTKVVGLSKDLLTEQQRKQNIDKAKTRLTNG